MKKKIMKNRVFTSSGKDLSMIVTSLLIEGTLLTDLRGLKTLMVLKTLKEVPSTPEAIEIISTTLVMTITKSIIFQPSLRYEFLC